ncbi:MAG: acyltransferase [Candidatus Pristimantibacillus sp.]
MKLRWIDFLKGVAILAVVLDHLHGIIYNNTQIHLLTQYSVTLFILLAGVTSGISNSNNTLKYSPYIIRKLRSIFIPYMLATVIYHIVANSYHFNFELFKQQLIMFNASGPFYFVLFYMQLVIVSPFLYKLFANRAIYQQGILLIVFYFISKYLTHYTAIEGYYGGAGKLLGGSYLFVFCFGIVVYLNLHLLDRVKKVWLWIGLLLSVGIYLLYINIGWLEKGWFNPPTKYTFMFALIVALIGWFAFHLVHTTWISKILFVVELLGKYSLYVFLYHSLFIHFGLQWFQSNLPLNLLEKLVFLLIVLLPGLLIGIVITKKKNIRKLLFKS